MLRLSFVNTATTKTTDEANSESFREQAGLIRKQVRCVCNDTLPKLISLTHDLPSSFALAGYPVHFADSQSAQFSLGLCSH